MKPTGDKRSLFRVLGEISAALNQSSHGQRLPGEALARVAGATGSAHAALYKKRLFDHGEYELALLGSWGKSNPNDPPSACPIDIRRKDISPSQWVRLERGEQVTFPSKGRQGRFAGVVTPLFLEDHLSGLLAVSGLKRAPFIKDFLWSVSSVFELWMARLNLEKRLNDLINFMPTPTFLMNTDEVITGWNRATEEMTGWKAERIVGKGNYENGIPFYNMRRPTVSNLIMYPDKKWESAYHEFQRDGDVVHSLAYCPALPGGGVFLSCKTMRLYDINNLLLGSIHTVRDVTLEREMEKSLHRSESMYRAISDFAGVGIMVFGADRIIYYNERLASFMGISGEEISKADFMAWIHPEDHLQLERHVKALLDGKQANLRFEFRANHRESIRSYRALAQLMEYEDQQAIHLILDDITEQKEMAEKARLNELRLYHEDRLTALGIMAAGIAHELNQPLNTVRVVTDGFLYGREESWNLDQEELFEGLEMISKQVERMSKVIQNIRNFAREDRGESSGEVNANKAIENTFSMIGRQLEAHGIQVRKELEDGLPSIKANLNRLEQVIMNLVVNARQALDDCQRERKELWIKTGANNGSVYIEVSDNASGIPVDFLMRVFDPFFTTKEVGKGTGLGLSISQSIVAEFKGRIEAFNNERGGATFVVTFPTGEEKVENPPR
jgi:PAS domain S-box-containing protein